MDLSLEEGISGYPIFTRKLDDWQKSKLPGAKECFIIGHKARAQAQSLSAQISVSFLVCSSAPDFSEFEWFYISDGWKSSRMEIVISGYKLHQEAQLLNEHYDLNTEIDCINLPSIGVHTPLAQQVYSSLGCSSNINKRFSSLSKLHEEGPHNNSRTVSQDLQNSGDHGPALRIWRTASGFPISLLSALSDPGCPGPSLCFRLVPSVVSDSPEFLDSELSDIFCKVFQGHCFSHCAMCSCAPGDTPPFELWSQPNLEESNLHVINSSNGEGMSSYVCAGRALYKFRRIVLTWRQLLSAFTMTIL